ncbi:T9SS type A sorting domain-containing protein [Lentimicrobium sp. L6]|uniref:M1 family aminopeptidase n=1 Tax=Lentimicrobium sp. L6 TaxID=2735916 RepID=UPI00155499F5|nr:M1 family aminopeptidase [Lentimicrobium sp. L6]NPD86458.1 T9SS type A sorting domain-containing protein [Lentimicrobium sp. L6]
MKNRFLLLLISSLFVSSFTLAQNHQNCNHRVSFEKSSLSDSLDVQSYHIFIDSILWDTDELYARTDISIKSKVDDLAIIPLELMNLIVDEVKVGGVQTDNFEQVGKRLIINLDDLLMADDLAELSISYHGTPFHESWGGFYIDNQYAYNLGVGFDIEPHNLGKSWFPCIDDFHDRAVYDVTVRVDDPLKAVAGGLLQEVIDHGDGTKSYHWHLAETIPTYLASVAVGDYVIHEDIYEGIDGDIPIKIYARPANASSVEASFINLKEILAYFEENFGAYPFERVGYVGTSIGAMEHATNIAYPNFAIDGTLGYEGLYTHELSHMWFGDQVTCASALDMWLNEGWATFSALFYMEQVYDIETYKAEMRYHHKEVLRNTHFKDGDYLALYGISHDLTYGSTVYDKGATVVQSLRGYLTDEVFFPAIKAYLSAYAYDYASSENMRDFLTDFTGIDMAYFFEAYVFTPGFSTFVIDSIQHISGDEYTIYARQKLKGKEVFANSNKVDITLMNNDWEQFDVRMEFDGETGSQTFTIPFEPIVAMVDLHENFCDATSDETKIIKETGEYNFEDSYFKLEVEDISDSALIQVSHHWVAPDTPENPQEGLTFSDYRYYEIDGIVPNNFQATGIFRYSMTSKLDHTLINDVFDSLVILFRPDASSHWHGIPFERTGSPFAGYIYVPNIQKGQYTLALWAEEFVSIKEEIVIRPEDYLQSYPNPSNGRVFFELMMPEEGSLLIFDQSGKQVDSVFIQAHQESAKWDGRRMPKGSYLVRLINKNGIELSQQKIIIQ